uniref:Uncharacterized protein n=1 Tax=Siphoviridae sp. ctXZx16 TaxID=2826371 RepID=A0A8S5MLL3_9CAUD|nr:MAG TPA: hypothetical protein [Siphoviridae sp. ctXZx16]
MERQICKFGTKRKKIKENIQKTTHCQLNQQQSKQNPKSNYFEA